MMRVTVLFVSLLAAGIANVSAAQPAQPDAFEKKFCSACHSVDKKMVGPAMKEIAKKYRDQKDATAYLSEKIKKGGAGVWGTVPMPPADVTEEETKLLVEWIGKL